MNGDELCKASANSRIEDVLAGSIRRESRVLSELVTGSNGEKGNKGPESEEPNNILDALLHLLSAMKDELIEIELNIDHIKENVGTDRFNKSNAP